MESNNIGLNVRSDNWFSGIYMTKPHSDTHRHNLINNKKINSLVTIYWKKI